VVRVVRTPGIADAIRSVAPAFEVEEVDVPGPATSADLRAAGRAEALVLLAAARAGTDLDRPGDQPGGWRVSTDRIGEGRAGVEVWSPDGAFARAVVSLGAEPGVRLDVGAGDPLDEIVLRSYCVGAAHMALSWVTSEGLAVDDGGEVHDLTIRSFGILRAVDTPPVEVRLWPGDDGTGPPVNASDAVFAAVAAATWIAQGLPPEWPTGLPVRR
jgi:xanthine dehydrogenase small subunit